MFSQLQIGRDAADRIRDYPGITKSLMSAITKRNTFLKTWDGQGGMNLREALEIAGIHDFDELLAILLFSATPSEPEERDTRVISSDRTITGKFSSLLEESGISLRKSEPLPSRSRQRKRDVPMKKNIKDEFSVVYSFFRSEEAQTKTIVLVIVPSLLEHRHMYEKIARRLAKYIPIVVFDPLQQGDSHFDLDGSFSWTWELEASVVHAVIESVKKENGSLIKSSGFALCGSSTAVNAIVHTASLARSDLFAVSLNGVDSDRLSLNEIAELSIAVNTTDQRQIMEKAHGRSLSFGTAALLSMPWIRTHRTREKLPTESDGALWDRNKIMNQTTKILQLHEGFVNIVDVVGMLDLPVMIGSATPEGAAASVRWKLLLNIQKQHRLSKGLISSIFATNISSADTSMLPWLLLDNLQSLATPNLFTRYLIDVGSETGNRNSLESASLAQYEVDRNFKTVLPILEQLMRVGTTNI